MFPAWQADCPPSLKAASLKPVSFVFAPVMGNDYQQDVVHDGR